MASLEKCHNCFLFIWQLFYTSGMPDHLPAISLQEDSHTGTHSNLYIISLIKQDVDRNKRKNVWICSTKCKPPDSWQGDITNVQNVEDFRLKTNLNAVVNGGIPCWYEPGLDFWSRKLMVLSLLDIFSTIRKQTFIFSLEKVWRSALLLIFRNKFF